MKEGFINFIIMDKTGWFTTNCLQRFNHIRLILLHPYNPKMDDFGYMKAKWYKELSQITQIAQIKVLY
jgi:hypothetical protein